MIYTLLIGLDEGLRLVFTSDRRIEQFEKNRALILLITPWLTI